MQIKMEQGASRVYVSYTMRKPSSVIHDFGLQVDSSRRDWKYLGIPAPLLEKATLRALDSATRTTETEVFMSLLGDGDGDGTENQYQVGYEDGYNGVPHLKP